MTVSPVGTSSPLEGQGYQRVFEVATDALFLYDDNYALRDVNPAACRLHGWSRDEMLRMAPTQFIHPSAHHVFAGFIEALRTEPSFQGLARGVRSDGSTFDVEVYGVPVDISGQRFYLSSVRDITYLQEATREVERSANRVKRVLAASGAAYWEHDLLSGEVISSDSCDAVFGGPFPGIGPWLRLGRADDNTALQRAWERHVAGETPRVVIERRLANPEGERWYRESAEVFARDPDGAPLLIAGTAIDISTERLLEARLARSERLEAMGRMAGGVAHDFNNLLTVVLGAADLSRSSVPADSELYEDLSSIVDAALRARRLTEQLVAFSRNQVRHPVALQLGREVAKLEPVLAKLMLPHHTLVVAAEDGLAPVTIDVSSLERVLVNLAVNALDAMPNGGTLSVTVGRADQQTPAGEASTCVRLTVRDTGSGMSPEVRERVFEPYFTTKPLGQGTGLGLATVYGIIQQSGGHLEVESTVGEGSALHIYLPTAEVEPAGVDPSWQAVARATDGQTVLVVDDDPAVCRVTRLTLERAGYRVVEAGDVASAKLTFAAHPEIALVISDVILGDDNGRQLAHHIWADRPDMPLLFISGYTQAVITGRGLLENGAAFLAKPFLTEQLLECVRDLLMRDAAAGETAQGST